MTDRGFKKTALRVDVLRNQVSVLDVESVTVRIGLAGGKAFNAVDNVDLSIMPGDIVGIVGESGSGKSMLAKAVMGLLPKAASLVNGSIRLNSQELLDMTSEELRRVRGAEISMIFQDPMTSLNPVIRVGGQIAETIRIHRNVAGSTVRSEVIGLLERVGIVDAARKYRSYPHEFSGGMRQRAMIAMGVANTPSLLIADEPTTALDVTVQKQILRLILDLSRASSTAVMFITHNMGVVASVCTRVAVMYSGRIVEEGPVDSIFESPQHPYTWSLLNSVPRLDHDRHARLNAIAGQSPDPASPPSGCRFHPRCPYAISRCVEQEPMMESVGLGHGVKCWVKMSAVKAQNAKH